MCKANEDQLNATKLEQCGFTKVSKMLWNKSRSVSSIADYNRIIQHFKVACFQIGMVREESNTTKLQNPLFNQVIWEWSGVVALDKHDIDLECCLWHHNSLVKALRPCISLWCHQLIMVMIYFPVAPGWLVTWHLQLKLLAQNWQQNQWRISQNGRYMVLLNRKGAYIGCHVIKSQSSFCVLHSASFAKNN